MSLSENIKKFRLEKNLTQEQLAAKLCISAQAVSKWETSDTYPDGTLLLPLARELGVSLDELFGNKSASMPDISRQIIALIRETDPDRRFPLAWDICWQIERGLFNCRMEIDTRYAPDEAKNQHNDSYILSDNGFTMVSNGSEPFFAVFPQPKEGFEDFLADKEALQNIFAALSHDETICLLSKLNAKQHIEINLDMDELDLTDAEKKATYQEIKDYVLEHSGLKVSSLYIAQVKQKCGIIERENYNKPKSEDAKQPQCPPDKEKAIKEALTHFGMI